MVKKEGGCKMIVHSFKGIIPPVITPIDQNSQLDQTSLKVIIDYLIDSKVNSLFFLGSIGEFSHMNETMRKKITEFVIDYVNQRVPVLIGTGSNTVAESVELSRFVERAGGDGVVVINPYYWKLSDKDLLHYFDSISTSISIPLMMYNFPDRTGQDLDHALVKNIVERNQNVIGIKDTIDSISHIKNIIMNVKDEHPDFCVLCGYDEHLVNTLLMGGDGGIIGTSNFAPELFINLLSAFRTNNMEEVKSMHLKIIQLSQIYGNEFSILSTIKECMQQKGFNISENNLGPLSKIDNEGKSKIQQIYEMYFLSK
jgi:2-dehydro-3-deoxy-D-pentonate aldolase